MTLRNVITTLCLVAAAAAGVFELKYSVVRLDAELAKLEEDIREERWRIRTLEADWAYLVRPERIAAHARQLGLVPAGVERVVEVGQIANRRQMELTRETVAITLPSGGEAELRFKPVATFDLDAMGDGG